MSPGFFIVAAEGGWAVENPTAIGEADLWVAVPCHQFEAKSRRVEVAADRKGC